VAVPSRKRSRKRVRSAGVVYVLAHKAAGRPSRPTVKEFLRFVPSRDGQRIVVDGGIGSRMRGRV